MNRKKKKQQTDNQGKNKKKQTDNQGDTEEVDHEEEQQAVEEEIETREAEVEEASIMMQDMEQIENDLNSLQDDSDEHPFKANGIDICALAESLIKGFSPLETLTKAELASIVAKIEADEVSSQDLKGIRKKKKTLKRVKAAVLDFVQKNCFCTQFAQQKWKMGRAYQKISNSAFDVPLSMYLQISTSIQLKFDSNVFV